MCRYIKYYDHKRLIIKNNNVDDDNVKVCGFCCILARVESIDRRFFHFYFTHLIIHLRTITATSTT